MQTNNIWCWSEHSQHWTLAFSSNKETTWTLPKLEHYISPAATCRSDRYLKTSYMKMYTSTQNIHKRRKTDTNVWWNKTLSRDKDKTRRDSLYMKGEKHTNIWQNRALYTDKEEARIDSIKDGEIWMKN